MNHHSIWDTAELHMKLWLVKLWHENALESDSNTAFNVLQCSYNYDST